MDARQQQFEHQEQICFFLYHLRLLRLFKDRN